MSTRTQLIISEAQLGVPFDISGQLTRSDTGYGINGQTIIISADGNVVAMATTSASGGVDGMFEGIRMQINFPGTYVFRADFAGSTSSDLIFDSSSGVRSLGVENAVVYIVLAVLGYSVIRTLYSWARPEWFLRKRVVRAR